MGIIDTLRAEGALVLYHDYRAGHCRDLSGQGNHGTPVDLEMGRTGANFASTSSKVTVSDSAEQRITEGTLVIAGEFKALPTNNACLLAKRDGSGTVYQMDMLNTSGVIRFYDGASSARTATTGMIGHRYAAINFKSGETPEAFVDGVSDGLMSGAVTVTVGTNDIGIGGFSWLSSYNIGNTIAAALIVNRKLTATEHAQVYAELAATRWPTQQSRGEARYLGRNRLVDGDMEASGVAAWVAVGSATLTKEDAGAGDQCLRVAYGGAINPAAQQATTEASKQYRVTGRARGDGARNPFVYANGAASPYVWTGTSSTAWQSFDEIFEAGGTQLRLYANAAGAGYVEFDNVEVRELVSGRRAALDDRLDGTLLWGTGWGVPVVANVAPGSFAGPFEVVSGAFAVGVDEIDGQLCKVIECTNDGVIAIPVSAMRQTPDDAAYGTWEWWASKAAGSTLRIGFVQDDTSITGAGKYQLVILGSETVKLTEASVADLFATGANYSSEATWQKFKITRSAAGVFYAYMDDELIDPSGGSGTNPATDTTITTSNFLIAEMDAGDKIALSDLSGGHGFVKRLGALAP